MVGLLMFSLYFYPRSPCGERPPNTFRHCTTYLFLSTLSLRRATYIRSIRKGTASNFYPRSPCGERRVCQGDKFQQGHFYPRSPCGERRNICVQNIPTLRFLSTLSLRRATFLPADRMSHQEFLSTLSLRRATGRQPALSQSSAFLSTLSLRRATYLGAGKSCDIRYFYPRSPCGERQALGLLGWLRVLISIHALLAESDSKSAQNSGALLRI